ncbi:MAG: protein kinase [Deltaproteobacteria bacterium]|nr:protein kinase [Deltaproteobacteria bacterium]
MQVSSPLLYGKYQLIELLARGGMAEVFKAKSHGVEGFEKVLVIKRILPHLSENAHFVEMFINEAKIAVTLNHANIVQVFDLGKADDTYFIAMEYVQGHNLADLARLCRNQGKPFPIELCVYVMSEVAKGLDYAHRRRDAHMKPLNIVHRDISPHNVLVSFEGEVKVTDFGIAKARTTIEDTDAGVVKGKYAYMSPEQARGERVDARSDIHAVGTVLYEILAGKAPFGGTGPYELLRRVRDGDRQPLLDAAPHVPPEIAQVVEKAMDVDPGRRHPNAAHLYEELIAYLYTSGRRVGAHDLSEFVATLDSGAEESLAEEQAERLREAFADEGASAMDRVGITSLEVPSSTGDGEAASHAGALPEGEVRDLSGLAIETLRGAMPADLEPAIAAIVHRHGGRIVDRTGGGMLALFGLGEADGRDTEYALRCAMKLQQVLSRDPRTRHAVTLGVKTGRVAMLPSGLPAEDDKYFGLGNEARSLAGATSGQVHVSPQTERLGRNAFQFAQSTTIPGAYVLVGQRSLAEVYGRFVGRKEELRVIGGQLAFANTGQGRVLSIVGEAGVGKTRLLHEVSKRLREGGHDIGWYEAQCLPQQRELPFSAVQGMLREILGIDETDPDPIVHGKVERLRTLGLSTEELRAVASLFGPIGASTEHSPRRMLRTALCRIATKLAEDRLTVLSWDAVNGLDDESEAVIDAMAQDIADSRVLCTLTYRPGFVHAWSALPGYHEIALGPLGDAECRKLVQYRLKSKEVPWELVTDVTTKSGGNPLFIEEHLKAMIDAGAIEQAGGKGFAVAYRRELAEVGVPRSLHGLVSARVSRLPHDKKTLLQYAAVIGVRFNVELLGEVADAELGALMTSLEDLEARGIVKRLSPSEWAFSHDLIHDVVYDAMPLADRKTIHGNVARTIEAIFPDRIDEYLERLAVHHREGGDRQKAIEYQVRSGDRRAQEFAFDAAIAHYGRAIELYASTRPDPVKLADLYRRTAQIAWKARRVDLGLEKARSAQEISEEAADVRGVVLALTLTGKLLALCARFDEATTYFTRALELAQQIGDETSERDILGAVGETLGRNGENRKALGYLEAAIERCERAGEPEPLAHYRLMAATVYAGLGDRIKAMETVDAAEAIYFGRGDRIGIVECHKLRSFALLLLVDFDGCAQAGLHALELAKEYGIPYEIAANSHNVGEAYIRLGDYKKAFTMLRYSHETCREHGFPKLQEINMMLLGYIDSVKFESDEGLARIEAAVRYAEENGYTFDVTQGQYYLGLAYKDRGDLERAKRAFRESLRLGNEAGNLLYAVECEQLLKEIDLLESVA